MTMLRLFRMTLSSTFDLKSALMVGASLFAQSSPVHAEPAIEGRIVAINVPKVMIGADTVTTWMSQPIQFDNSSFIRLHFTDIRIVGSGIGTVRVVGQGGDVLAKWSFKEFSSRGDRWTKIMPEGYAVVQVEKNNNRPVQLEFTIKEAARESEGGTVLSRQDPSHIRDKDISAFSDNLALMSAARSVAKLSFPIGKKLATCTGFMITDNLLLTNHHCISTIDTCFATVAIFGYQRDRSGRILPTKQYDCIAVVATDITLDYSLLRMDGSPGEISQWGSLKIDHLAVLVASQPLYMVQHPSGEPKRVTMDNCRVSTLEAEGSLSGFKSDFGHVCDTESGSSGSPMIDRSNHVVGLHHLGFDAKNRRWSRENRAVSINSIAVEIDRYLH